MHNTILINQPEQIMPKTNTNTVEDWQLANGLVMHFESNKKEDNNFANSCQLSFTFTKQESYLNIKFERMNNLHSENIEFSISKNYIFQYLQSIMGNEILENKILQFQLDKHFIATIDICNQSNELLSKIVYLNKNLAINKILLSGYILQLLYITIQNIDQNPNIETEKVEKFECKFLANEDGREKIYLAEKYLINNLGTPFTIKELSKLVAINECYLKKGFKEIFGKSINEYYQNKRMLHAKDLLYHQGLSVTEIAQILGFSSISHFSTAFKKHTGIKPCELLVRF